MIFFFFCFPLFHKPRCPTSRQAALGDTFPVYLQADLSLNRTIHELLFKDLCLGQEQMCPG